MESFLILFFCDIGIFINAVCDGGNRVGMMGLGSEIAVNTTFAHLEIRAV